MITATGYSKDPSIMPEGIVVTFGQQMISEQGGLKTFLEAFQEQCLTMKMVGIGCIPCQIFPDQKQITFTSS